MSDQFTSQQVDAIEAEACSGVLLEAGAGSGKTHVIVDRYIENFKSFEPNEFLSLKSSPVAAITFTEKSTEELKRRVNSRLVELLNSNEKPWIAPIEKKCREFIKKPELLNISTIHGFCSREIWKNRIPLGLGPKLKILDELESSLLKEQVLRELFSRTANVFPDFSEFRIREMFRLMDSKVDYFLKLEPSKSNWLEDIKKDKKEFFKIEVYGASPLN
jgi:ATP-dependent exoDNAse (exonuclease V) beta subunit